MTRESFSNFVHSVEHSFSLRQELKKCFNNPQKILLLASKYGFEISMNDLKEDDEANKTLDWFKSSEIPPIRKT